MPCTGKAMSSDSDRWSETHVLVCGRACFRNQVLLSLQTIMINLVQAQMRRFWVWAHLPATQMLWVLLGWCVFTGKKKDANSGLEDFVVYTLYMWHSYSSCGNIVWLWAVLRLSAFYCYYKFLRQLFWKTLTLAHSLRFQPMIIGHSLAAYSKGAHRGGK